MTAFLVVPVMAFALACGGGSSSNAVVTKASFKFQTGIKTDPLTKGARTVAGIVIDPSDIQFHVGLKASQGGTLVAGYSGSANTLTFDVTTEVDGVTVGANGVSQTFQPTDPSIINSSLTGPALPAAPGGIFMTRFSASGSTTMHVESRASADTLPQVNEVVLRMAVHQERLVDADGHTATLVAGPHFFINGTLYSDPTQNLKIASVSNAAQGFEYILFVPASMIGAGKSFLVLGDNTVISPVTGDYGPGTDPNDSSTWGYTDPSTWTTKDTTAWINDPGCAGLVAVIDAVAGTDHDAQAWKDLADYFKAYFVKFYAARSTMFQPNGILGNTSHPGTFEIVALDDITNGPMLMSGGSTLNLVYDPTGTSFDLTSGVLDLTGNPPVKFTTSVVTR